METNMEKQIREGKSSFDVCNLPDGNMERFEARLNETASHSRRKYWISFAAGVAAVFVLTFTLPFGENKMEKMQESSCEFQEVQAFYQMRLNEQVEALQPQLMRLQSDERQLLMHDLRELSSLTFNDADFVALPEEKKIECIVQNYHIRSNSVIMIANRLR